MTPETAMQSLWLYELGELSFVTPGAVRSARLAVARTRVAQTLGISPELAQNFLLDLGLLLSPPAFAASAQTAPQTQPALVAAVAASEPIGWPSARAMWLKGRCAVGRVFRKFL